MCYCRCEVVTVGVKGLLQVWRCYCGSECVTAGVTFLL